MGDMLTGHELVLKLTDRTLALTYDDGPGPWTMEIAEFLFKRGIPATFFMVGRQVVAHRDFVHNVQKFGHTIANHTYSHRDLTTLTASPRELIDEVLQADRCIQEYVGGNCCLLRPPFGKWNSQVADILNRESELHKYLGPVSWDINFGDYEIGSRSDRSRNAEPYTLKECCAAYMNSISEKRCGVVLLHDWSADPGPRGDELRRNNRTLELTQWLVERLAGYSFAALGGMRVYER